MKGQGWTLDYTWSSTPSGSGDHYGIGLSYGGALSYGDTANGYVTCVHGKSEAEIKPIRQTELPKSFVAQGGLTWMPVNSSEKNWSSANAYCTNTTINGQTGWRLPTKDELKSLYDSGMMKGQGWTLSVTWSSTPLGGAYHYLVTLDIGVVNANLDSTEYYVTCVHKSLGL